MDRLWQDPALAADMGRQAQARYWQHFTADQMSRSYFSLYQALVSVG
jgi:rhamnosyl/mannosyltransferase